MPSDVSTMQSIQTKFQQELKDRPYLLILDDVWTKDPNEWNKLRIYLTMGGRGSKVIITTRSEKTAEVILGRDTHCNKIMLRGLSDKDSWRLFELTAFERESDQANDPLLIKLGIKFVKKCSNVPLAIKVLGTLLYGQTHRWESFEENRLPQIEIAKNPIISILKLTYSSLEPSVKNCFKYCALFPKDSIMDKQKLISLWMAQGYIGDSEDNFLVLLKRCFFQDVKKDELGNVVSFKMHDLMHDLAQEVVGDEIIVVNTLPNNLSKKNRHIYLDGGEWIQSSFGERNIRTCYINTRVELDLVKTLISSWHCLRSLCLYWLEAEKLPESIGDLLHLRHLDLSENRFLEALPNSIVKLYNLQSLILYNCCSLTEWPKYFYKLVNLRLLDISECVRLSCMPLGIAKMTNLRGLTDFKVSSVSPVGGELKDLKCLVNLLGELKITISENLVCEKENVCSGNYLERTRKLAVLQIKFDQLEESCDEDEEARKTNNYTLVAKLQPNQNLKQLNLDRYNGTEIPRWGRAQDDWASVLPNLVKIEFHDCVRLHGIPSLRNLKHLKCLYLLQLDNLEYMETNAMSQGGFGSKDILPFFPFLESLGIADMQRLKGWWGGVGEGDRSSMTFPCLKYLHITDCPELTSFPSCPSLEKLLLSHSNKSLRILHGEGLSNSDIALRVEKIDSVGYLTTLPAKRLTYILIGNDRKWEANLEIDEVFKNCSALQSLKIKFCTRLRNVSGVVKHLTALESLTLEYIPGLADDPNDDMPWRSLSHNLHSLTLSHVTSLEILPRGMKHLTALRSLLIYNCELLEGLPEWSCLSSLHSLKISQCDSLRSLGSIQNITSLQEFEISGCRPLLD